MKDYTYLFTHLRDRKNLYFISFTGGKPDNPKQALELSIAKWKYMLNLATTLALEYVGLDAPCIYIFDGGCTTCGLCKYFDRPGWEKCGNDNPCPIKKFYGGCEKTPYNDYSNLVVDTLGATPVEWVEVIKAEYDFLLKLYEELYGGSNN